MTRIVCVIIATLKRRHQLPRVVTSACAQGFDDIVVVGDWELDPHIDGIALLGMRYLCVSPLTHTTTDALVKRDVGTLAVPEASVLVYLCDDHTLHPEFGAALRSVLHEPWDVIVPNRNAWKPDGQALQLVPLNNGEHDFYCGGHAGVFKRHVVTERPWSAHAHHPNWDVLISAEQLARGARFVWSPRAELSVTDIEPNAEPWL